MWLSVFGGLKVEEISAPLFAKEFRAHPTVKHKFVYSPHPRCVFAVETVYIRR